MTEIIPTPQPGQEAETLYSVELTFLSSFHNCLL